MRPVILYRGSDFVDRELADARKAGFYCTDSRLDLKAGDIVVGRYSVLPFYRELERDVMRVGARLLNSYSQHQYIADIGQWYQDFKDVTPKTWSSIVEIPDDEPGPYVVKGETNSRKFLFDTHMYAEDRKAASAVFGRLLDDTMISQQKLYIRKFEKLHTYCVGLHGLPITKEFRLFYAYGTLLSIGYYWSSHTGDLEDMGLNVPSIEPDALHLMEDIEKRLYKVAGVVVDIAQKEDGSWIVIELNDLQMAGLSDNHPGILYPALFEAIVSNNQHTMEISI